MKKTILITLILTVSLLCFTDCKKEILNEAPKHGETSKNDDTGNEKSQNEKSEEENKDNNKEKEEGNTTNSESTILKKLVNGVLKGEKEIDVREFNITKDKADSIYNNFIRNSPLLFHLRVAGNVGYRVDLENQDFLAAYIPQYSVSTNVINNIYPALEKAIEEYCSLIDYRMTQPEIAYILYQKLCKEVVYGERNDEFPGLAYGAFSAIGAFITHKVVCQGYSLSYSFLLNGLGIKTNYVTGAIPGTSGHAWNRIYIDGEWYNADATFDDASSNNQTAIYSINKYFLCSDNLFYTVFGHARPHLNLQEDIYEKSGNKFDSDKCVIRRFDTKGEIIKTEAMFANGFWYYISLNDEKMKIIKSDFKGEDIKVIRQQNISSVTGNTDKIKLTKDRIFFLDFIDNKYHICSIDYDGNDFRKEKQISFIEAVSKGLILTNDESKPIHTFKGIMELKAELLLAKLKLLYFHGDEDYFNLTQPQAKELDELIKNTENIIKNNQPDDLLIEKLTNEIKEKRKAYNQPISIVY